MKHFFMKYWVLSGLILWLAVTATSAQPAANTASIRQISLSANAVKGDLNRNFNFCVGAGRANEGLRADWQRQLRQAKDAIGFRYIRFHGLLSDDMGVYSEDKSGKSVYNWQYIDELYDFLLSIKMKPFVELGFMPDALASGKKTIFWWKGNITPPKDDEKWKALIKALVNHWTERYGAAEVKSWYFEVWNEPNLKDAFFSGTRDDYFKLYRETAEAIKSVSKSYRVGGPATAGNAWIPETIDFCVQQKVPIDFISTHTYGVKQGFLDANGDAGVIVSQNRDAVWSDMRRSREQINKSPLPGLELHYTEWSSSYTPADPMHDNYQQAAYILDKIKNGGPFVTSLSYWTFTDIFEEAGPRSTPFHGGFGLMNYQDIKKPAFYAYQYLNQLGTTELKNTDSQSIACKDPQGNMQLLCWDFTITHPGDSVNDQVYYKRDLRAKSTGSIQITIQDLPAGKYKLTTYRVGYRVNDAYSTYFDLHSPSQLSRDQVSWIKQANNGAAISSTSINVGQKGISKTIPMRQNDVYLFKIEKVK